MTPICMRFSGFRGINGFSHCSRLAAPNSDECIIIWLVAVVGGRDFARQTSHAEGVVAWLEEHGFAIQCLTLPPKIWNPTWQVAELCFERKVFGDRGWHVPRLRIPTPLLKRHGLPEPDLFFTYTPDWRRWHKGPFCQRGGITPSLFADVGFQESLRSCHADQRNWPLTSWSRNRGESMGFSGLDSVYQTRTYPAL